MKWIEIQIKTTSEAVEAVTSILYEVGAGGLAIEDPNDIISYANSDENWDFIEASLLEQQYDGVIVKAYFPESEDLIDKIELIKQNVEKIPQFNLDKGLGEVTTTEVYEKDWADSWKKYYKPKKIGDRIVIKPSWEEYEVEDNDIIIELDPGMAFGTGTHETTIMCIKQLEKYVNEGNVVFDIGCGSGILSIAAAKLGAKKVIGVDLDELSVKVSNENAKMNKVENIVDIKHGNLLDVIKEKADLVVSNIVAEIITVLSKDVTKFLNKEGIFITSGIIHEKTQTVKEAMIEEGLEILDTVTMGEWVCIVAKLGEDKKYA
ncbi:[LSU ribosomal protein L11P]-lysine N-methyltransferase [Proteiniborus ethanoligenes]|uniref:Ribosomal protein L11 methyltransferase n=1 Tax=Proteiniborus ethanoligenes TaxID=415015 RepID=A0A1H3R356_9FIRM|nr:50S ribosomal protein L11 methyltransferase [Proteiniborus ethanoligenes]TAH63014.1 MAG: 50S ribosomal protein L11 methyltransferase [Gottschalkiaceae bacterium]SDZ19741.1 [LSU ribosomal protein L11P]-lysine N-methyltransferase [Proteiniborus ethanoligenes]